MADDPKLTEFRERNIALLKEIGDLKARYEGIDPDAVAADKAKLAALEKAQPEARITELESALAAEKAARAAAQASVDAGLLKAAVRTAFIAAGGRDDATDYIFSKAAEKLGIENGVIVGKAFDPNKPGIKLDVDGFIALQVRESPFAFKRSSGGGATGSHGGGDGRSSSGRELRNPTPQQLGQYAADIKAGRIKVVND